MNPFLPDALDPLALFQSWLAEAGRSEPNDPNAMALATASAAGVPSVRMVLLKRADEHGFVFYTNRESRKGKELRANPHAALCFHWKSLQRQVRVAGTVTEVPGEDADAYFASRSRMSQIGAWASLQSRPLPSRTLLEERAHEYEMQFPGAVPRPPYWTGFAVDPERIEFWESRSYRLHDRVVFVRAEGAWTKERLYP